MLAHLIGKLYDDSCASTVDAPGKKARLFDAVRTALRQVIGTYGIALVHDPLEAIKDADVCLFVIDARAGLTPNDRAFADFARRANKPVVLVANKSEGKQGDAGAMESYALGLGDPIQISAEHGEGMADLFDLLLPHVEQGKLAPADWPKRA